jgi:hypothetical protein
LAVAILGIIPLSSSLFSLSVLCVPVFFSHNTCVTVTQITRAISTSQVLWQLQRSFFQIRCHWQVSGVRTQYLWTIIVWSTTLLLFLFFFIYSYFIALSWSDNEERRMEVIVASFLSTGIIFYYLIKLINLPAIFSFLKVFLNLIWMLNLFCICWDNHDFSYFFNKIHYIDWFLSVNSASYVQIGIT